MSRFMVQSSVEDSRRVDILFLNDASVAPIITRRGVKNKRVALKEISKFLKGKDKAITKIEKVQIGDEEKVVVNHESNGIVFSSSPYSSEKSAKGGLASYDKAMGEDNKTIFIEYGL